jgi:hypothetical protein
MARAREGGSALPGAGRSEQLLELGPFAREQRYRNTLILCGLADLMRGRRVAARLPSAYRG